MNNFAIWLAKVDSRHPDAELYFKKVLANNKRNHGKTHSSTLNSLNNLACYLKMVENNEEAEKVFVEALNGYKTIENGLQCAEALSILNNLAVVQKNLDKYDEAERSFRQASKGRQQCLGPNHPDTLTSMNKLANLLRDKGDLDEAEKLYEEVIRLRTVRLGPRHRDTLSSISSLAVLLNTKGRLDEAETLCRKALAGRLKTFGAAHPDTLSSLNHLGTLMSEQRNFFEAEGLYRKILIVYEKLYGVNDPNTLKCVHELAFTIFNQIHGLVVESNWLMVRDKLKVAEDLFRRAQKGRQNTIGRSHPDTLNSAYHIVLTILKREKIVHDTQISEGLHNDSDVRSDAEVEAILRYVLKGRERSLGTNHHLTVETADLLSNILRKRGLITEAEELHKRKLEFDRANQQIIKAIMQKKHVNTDGDILTHSGSIKKSKKYSVSGKSQDDATTPELEVQCSTEIIGTTEITSKREEKDCESKKQESSESAFQKQDSMLGMPSLQESESVSQFQTS
jgi:tetratricopeptide (TPR) repeat protein